MLVAQGLHELHIGQNECLTDDFLDALAAANPCLQHLTVFVPSLHQQNRASQRGLAAAIGVSWAFCAASGCNVLQT